MFLPINIDSPEDKNPTTIDAEIQFSITTPTNKKQYLFTKMPQMLRLQ